MGRIVSALVDAALARAGLEGVLAARLGGDLSAVHAHGSGLRSADLLVLGAMADRVRAAEVGDEVRIYLTGAPERGATVLRGPGFELLREVALARILGPKRGRVRVDFAAVGLELAQVALGFGADELSGTPTTKRGLPIAPDALTDRGKRSARVSLASAKRAEIEALVRRAGRRPVTCGASDAPATPEEAHP